jgi:hypothetical protein
VIERVTNAEGRRLLAALGPRKTAKNHTDWADVLVGQIKAKRLPEPVREYRFGGLGGRRWRLDCAWIDMLLAVEVNGSEFVHGRHNRGLGMAADFEKLNAALLDGWGVLLFTGSQVRNGYAIGLLEKVLR